ncbi:MAG: 30S ribosomal protein S12 methylthiotransferase RimO [Eubacteriaceae bacterium]
MKNKKIHMTTLGCDKNTIDSQMMMGIVSENNYELDEDPSKAEIIIVNTCCFIQEAKEESIAYILEYVKFKNQGSCEILIVAGCMAERYHEELALEIPEIDGFLGVGHFENIIELLENAGEKIRNDFVGNINTDYPEGIQRLIPDNAYSTYIRISEGCNHHCTYCIIPKIRGKYRSRKSEEIYKELEYLEKNGIKEVIIIAQDIAPYGTDLEEDINLGVLLEKIATNYSFEWIRMMYLYPEGINEKLLEVVKRYRNICNYFDIPFQHTVDKILNKMGRKMTTEKIKLLCDQIRKKIPDVIIRTSIITGFPGETEEDHEALLKDLKEIKFDHLGVFKYSQEEETPAAKFANQIKNRTKEKRFAEIMLCQQEISLERNQNQVGRNLKVLIEEKDEECYIGRCYGDAPEIDGAVYVDSKDACLETGNFYPVKIVNALEYDLIGEITNELT